MGLNYGWKQVTKIDILLGHTLLCSWETLSVLLWDSTCKEFFLDDRRRYVHKGTGFVSPKKKCLKHSLSL